MSEIFLAKTLNELGFATEIYTARNDCADILAKSQFHNYTFVSDAKTFRLSRKAKNQKDFKVDSMNVWKKDNDYAVLCCPYFEYPRSKSQIYKQAIENNVSLFSWEYLYFFISNNIKETLTFNMSNILGYITILQVDCKRCGRKARRQEDGAEFHCNKLLES